ncbi:MAG TPA: type 4a pilus biogenesis protein PilO [Candidatus Acidoferrum sp.]|jgi:type IV pilus assembly protein PilO|nr:type 4a pilus biogenesis protein PilO [Candidatus Acidoferrum sp.]
MAMNFSELSGLKQWATVILGGALVTGALYFTAFKSQSDKNAAAEKAVQDKVKENNELESYRPKLKDMERQLANLKQQLEIERRIVPDEKQVDTFIEMMEDVAQKEGVWLRRYSAKPVSSKEYYTEVPFDIDLDGPYYSMLHFFDHVARLERIVNISGLMVANTKNASDAKVKHTYQYAANESVAASFTATTFFSHDLEVPVSTPGSKPGSVRK